MAFRASNVRKRREREPVGEGTQLIASAPIRQWYERKIKDVCRAMLRDYNEQLELALEHPSVEQHFATDASAASVYSDILAALNKKWINIFKNYAKETAEAFTEKVDAHSKATVWHSLSVAGVDQPVQTYTKNIRNTLQASVDFNHTLVTNIQADIHEKIYNGVMLSLTSPNPEEQGTQGIFAAVKKAGQFSDDRAELIARDQNSKVYSSLNIDRIRDSGVKKFRWIHSSAGKVPRESHVEKDGEIFELDDPRLWTGKKADQGPPGWAINCRCRAVPIID